MKYSKLNGLNTYAPSTTDELIDHAFKNKSILVAVNAEKIIHSNEQTRDIILNRNVGYPGNWYWCSMGFKEKGF